MGIKVRWLLEDRVVLSYIFGVFTSDEMVNGQEDVAQYIRAGGAKGYEVHDVIDMRDMRDYPKNLSQIVKSTPVFSEPALGWVVLISHDPLVMFLTKAVMKVAGKKLKTCKTPEEALEFLAQTDNTLSPFPKYPIE